DGGARTLELQVIEPIRNPLEMDTTLESVRARLATDPELVALFEQAYGEGPSEFTIPRALASFVRSLLSGQSAWDRYRRGEHLALSDSAARGLELFNGERAECFHCHVGFNFTNNSFRNNGGRADDPDVGREKLTGKASDRGKFKVPSLRNVAVTAPYMHDGSLATLDAVIDRYVAGGLGHPNTDPVVFPLDLTDSEKADLKAFLESLTDPEFLSEPSFADPASAAL
ncbi:MAG TPA: cytochrome c peroxidase, partial [Polyangiaceae bacterium]|nr:cytochrome c peroxidase [Polyangiaceae bacterium]